MTTALKSERTAPTASATPTVLGADAGRQLNAIEGIVADETSRALIGRLAGQGLTTAQRRAALKAHFTKAALG